MSFRAEQSNFHSYCGYPVRSCNSILRCFTSHTSIGKDTFIKKGDKRTSVAAVAWRLSSSSVAGIVAGWFSGVPGVYQYKTQATRLTVQSVFVRSILWGLKHSNHMSQHVHDHAHIGHFSLEKCRTHRRGGLRKCIGGTLCGCRLHNCADSSTLHGSHRLRWSNLIHNLFWLTQPLVCRLGPEKGSGCFCHKKCHWCGVNKQ